MLSDAEMCDYREAVEDLLDGTCVIERLQTASDGQGGTTSSWTAAGTVCCNVSPLTGGSGRSDIEGGQPREVGARIVTLPAETDIRTTDRLVTGGQTLEVTDAREPRTREFVRRVEARIV